MKIWKLTPIKLDSPHMLASWHKDYALVRAHSEEEARTLAQNYLSIATARGSHQPDITLFNPWTLHDVVSCAVYEGSELERDGEPCVLHPVV